MVVTSATRPITTSVVYAPPQGEGALLLSFCPGKCVKKKGKVVVDRDMEMDMAALRDTHAVRVHVNLLNKYELRAMGIEHLDQTSAKYFEQYIEYPIVEMAPPDSLEDTVGLILQLVQLIHEGKRVLVHCRGGVGRAGVVAACMLLHTGEAATAKEAIALCRKRRSKNAVESYRQEQFVQQYASHLKQHPDVAAAAVFHLDMPATTANADASADADVDDELANRAELAAPAHEDEDDDQQQQEEEEEEEEDVGTSAMDPSAASGSDTTL